MFLKIYPSSKAMLSRSMSSSIQRVGVVGLGLMGHGIAQISAMSGYEVLAIETNDAALNVGIARIENSLGKALSKEVAKGKLTEINMKLKYDETMSRIATTINLSDAHDCDLIIEAIVENENIKIEFYERLGPLIKPSAIFASNTSSLPVTTMAIRSGRPDKFVGLHFFNPVQIFLRDVRCEFKKQLFRYQNQNFFDDSVLFNLLNFIPYQIMRLLEVIRTEHTSDETFDTVTGFGKDIGKATVSAKDTPGFIVNRLLVPYLMQAMCMVDRHDASVSDIDLSMQLGAGHPMGPLHLADYIGLDTAFNIITGWKKEFPNDPSFILPLCLADKVANGELGRKSGKGFYHWSGDKVLGPA